MTHLLTVLFCVLAVSLRAQTTTDAYWNLTPSPTQSQAILKLSSTVIPDPSSSLNTIQLQQTGSGNAATLQTISGVQNLLSVNQGGGEVANATLIGSNNSLMITQTGGGNAVNMDLTGSGNRFMFTQDGGDTINMLGQQKNNTRLEVAQGAGSNSLTLDNSTLFVDPLSQGIPNLRIEQSGGASITVHQGKIIGN